MWGSTTDGQSLASVYFAQHRLALWNLLPQDVMAVASSITAFQGGLITEGEAWPAGASTFQQKSASERLLAVDWTSASGLLTGLPEMATVGSRG